MTASSRICRLAPETRDSQNIYSTRGSIRWQPTSTTTIDFIGSYDNEADSRDRIDGIMCHTDPTGVIGCLPDKLAFQPINSLGNAIGVLDSKQWMGTIGQSVGLAVAEPQASILLERERVRPSFRVQYRSPFRPNLEQ